MRHHRLGAIGILLLVCLPLGAVSLQEADVALVLSGTVNITTDPNGTMTVVSIDVPSVAGTSDGLADHAFRLQHEGMPPLAYQGPARITYKKNRLTVAVDGVTGWVFSVASRDNTLNGLATSYPRYAIVGLSHFWGPGVHRAPEQLAIAMSMDPGCDTCQSGGGTETGCGITCEGGVECYASCDEGYFACCNCPSSCRCCKR
jgi:hypothetical protein